MMFNLQTDNPFSIQTLYATIKMTHLCVNEWNVNPSIAYQHAIHICHTVHLMKIFLKYNIPACVFSVFLEIWDFNSPPWSAHGRTNHSESGPPYELFWRDSAKRYLVESFVSKNLSDLCPHVWIPADLMPRNIKLLDLLYFAFCEAFLYVHFYTSYLKSDFYLFWMRSLSFWSCNISLGVARPLKVNNEYLWL